MVDVSAHLAESAPGKAIKRLPGVDRMDRRSGTQATVGRQIRARGLQPFAWCSGTGGVIVSWSDVAVNSYGSLFSY